METLRKTVLVADDEPNIRQLVSQTLGDSYNVLQAKDGAEAVTMAFQQVPDLVLMDVMMPGLDGLQACFRIKSDIRGAAIRVVMLTAVCHEMNKTLSQTVMKADGYMTKPFDTEALLETVNRMLAPVPAK